MKRVLISACLLGQPVRYDGSSVRWADPILKTWQEEGRLVSVCPEVVGGMAVPRPPCEIHHGDGLSVLSGETPVVTREGEDVTALFVNGAKLCLQLAREQGCVLAIFTEKSPSCGSDWTYDGSFNGVLKEGQGVTTALLEREGIRVFSQFKLAEASEYLAALEAEEDKGS